MLSGRGGPLDVLVIDSVAALTHEPRDRGVERATRPVAPGPPSMSQACASSPGNSAVQTTIAIYQSAARKDRRYLRLT